MKAEDLLLEQYRMINSYLKRAINEEDDIQDVKFFIEEVQHKLSYLYKLKQKILKQKKEVNKHEKF